MAKTTKRTSVNISSEASKSFSEIKASTPREAAVNFLVSVLSPASRETFGFGSGDAFTSEQKMRASELLLKYADDSCDDVH